MRAKSKHHTTEARAWQAFHADNVRTYAAAWQDNKQARRLGMRRDEAAAGLLEHAGLLWRYTADKRICNELRDWAPPRRRKLIGDACRYFKRSTYSTQMASLCAHDALSDEHLERIQSLLLLRDGAQAALDLAAYIGEDLCARDRKLQFALADAHAQFAKGDAAILERPDILSVAGKIFAPLRQLIRTPLDETKYWWVYHAAALDQQFAEEEQTGSLFTRLRIPAPRPRILKHLPTNLTFDLRNVEMVQPVAAKTAEKASFIVATRKSLMSLVPALRGRRQTTIPNPATVPAAQAFPLPVVFGPRSVPENPCLAAVQWDAAGLPRLPRKQALALVVERSTGKLLGVAQFDPSTKMITLVEGAWADFEPYARETERLLLLLTTSPT